MTNKEFKHLLEEQGWKPEECTMPVPFYECGVPAGIPNIAGDYMGDVVLLPETWRRDEALMVLNVKGDSMKDLYIDNDDAVVVECGKKYNDGDVVVASLDGETTVKAFSHDRNGHPWLIPANSKYLPIDLAAYQNPCVLGRVVRVIKPAPHMQFNYQQERFEALEAAMAATENPVDTSVLESPDALICWAALREAGVVDERNRAKDGVWMDALIADVMGDYLGIRNKWKVFCAYHGKKYEGGNNALSDSLNKKKNQREVKKIKKFLEGIICYKQ